MLNTAAWAAVMVLLAWVSWRAAHKHMPSMWLALIASIVLALFTASVLFGLNPYDLGGGLDDPTIRLALYMLFTPLALLAVVGSSLALITTYRLRQWDRPVIDRPDIDDTIVTQ
jgi:hypothetical protein